MSIIQEKVIYRGGRLVPVSAVAESFDEAAAQRGTMASRILSAHNSGTEEKLRIKFDALASHDITYVGIIQTARASGLESFPVPYVLTNCHNSLCAVGGTINEDDHRYGLSAARRYGGYFVPAHQSVIHQYMRECFAGCGKMILGSDSHTRYGALGTLAVGEGGPELVKQILGKTYDIDRPEVIAVHLTGKPRPGVGPQDVALTLIGQVFASGFVKNRVVEFVGDGIANLSVDYRIGIDVMTTESACLSSIWLTDERVHEWLALHGRGGDYTALAPEEGALYDGAVEIDLSRVESMIALPFHPSNVYSIRELNENMEDILHKVETEGNQMLPDGVTFTLRDKVRNGRLYAQQGIVAGCAGGGFENLMYLSRALDGKSIGSGDFDMSIYPASQPVFLELIRNGALSRIMAAGVGCKTAFCGPCFGAGDTPNNNGLSIRHSTRNFPNREGSKPGNGQIASVALMDARSIAASALMGGAITPATELGIGEYEGGYHYDDAPYASRVYNGYGKPDKTQELVLGPNITDWPAQPELPENLLMRMVSVISDPVTTTDELIPSGETSSYRSNPKGLAEFALSRKDPGYVGRAKEVAAMSHEDAAAVLAAAGIAADDFGVGSCIYAVRPGDGSAREQAASCQRVLGGCANIAYEYATRRYRANLMNWGMLPFTFAGDGPATFTVGQYVYVPGIREALKNGLTEVEALILNGDKTSPVKLSLPAFTEEERDILLAGCLINYYR
ncbi:MAG: hydratase [Ruminococcaceae bacterium]|nr:hydratase [Oscillospiraceae bacterium]